MAAIDLAAAPFNLDEDGQAWVATTLASLTPRDKLAQLFVLMVRGEPNAVLEGLLRFKPGGITRLYTPDLEDELGLARDFIAGSAIAPLISADLEGSRMSLPFGTSVPNPLGLAAVDDVSATEAIAGIMAREARAVGLNWSFTPVIDINAAFKSAIVGTRSYGSEVDRIERHALAQIAAFQGEGVAATVKHWPGEGFDARDQHLVTTVNPLDIAHWEANFGRLYRAAIEAGVMAVMAGHIAFPAFVRALDPQAGEEAFRPASISGALNQGLLRERLGFNGLIVSDATAMAGLGDWGPRDITLPEVVANGCDVILFSDEPEADLRRLVSAIADGRLTQERVDAAVTRILALKAALGLHKRQAPLSVTAARAVLDDPASQITAHSVTSRVPTLVKDKQNLLPLNPHKHRRILVFSGDVVLPLAPGPVALSLPDLLVREGFEVTRFSPGMAVNPKAFDLVLYLFGEETLLTRGSIFLDWMKLTGSLFGAMHRYWHEVPTLMISFGYPYYLYDAPRVKTYINAYGTSEPIQAAVLEALVGRTTFAGTNPVDPFTGSEQGKY
ncbi:glycoside hydrolase family 3 protein [uncultured Devosia sp.]|uniref:glycoside hydrolase family 3 protein n=1 Tax=uncultured Devosia sp. TaxID=211434 RepID=UPI0035CAA604